MDAIPAVLARDIAQIKRDLAEVKAITHVTWMRTRPQMDWYFALPLAVVLYGAILSPLRTAGTSVSPMVDRVFTVSRQAAQDAGAWLASLSYAMPAIYRGQALRGLSNGQTGALMAALIQRENSGSYDGWNKFGYIGGFQAGAAALVQTGYMKRGALDSADECVKEGTCGKSHLEFLQNNGNWMEGHTFEQFMASHEMQNEFFVKLANFNIEQGFKRGVLKEGQYERIAGFVAVSHLQGIGAAVDYFLYGIDTKKGGAYASEYAGIGAAAVKTTDVIATASRFIGLHEEANNRQLAVFMSKAGFSLNPDVTAWCAAFANAVLHENGIAGTGKLNARSFLNWGAKTDTPKLGDIVVLWRGSRDGWLGHVGFFKGFDSNGNVLILGGNQTEPGSRHSEWVSIDRFPVNRVLGYRTAPKKFI